MYGFSSGDIILHHLFVKVRKSTKKVVLNSAEIEIQSAKYVQGAQG